ncbi:hypothetical protein [Halioxenophilus sp. WMMB6]|uniref:hypothetical protein n=1 Tax=Halioxenophilus sp. WMMB6 TaxID=3073815 RepID=UPI00295E9C7A|nr:hypothetical protein [Halioxenophilus sp. WMMB6]
MYRTIGGVSLILVVAIAALWIVIDGRSKDIEQLNRFAAAGNSQTPQMIDSITRLDSVSVEFPAVVFHYTLLLPASEIDIEKVKESNINWFKDQACGNSDVQKSILEPGYEIVRTYQDIEQHHVFRMSLGNSLCGQNT